MSPRKEFWLVGLLFWINCISNVIESYNVPCTFNTMCMCWVQDDDDFTKMDITCMGVPFARFPGTYTGFSFLLFLFFFFYFLFRPPFTRFLLIFPLIYPRLTLDVSVSYVAQLDIVGSGMQILDNDALESSVGVEALGLMSNRLVSIGDTSLR